MIAHARAPLRIDLAGGWTDVAPYVERGGGAVVNVAITRYAHAQVRPRPAGVSLHAAHLGAGVSAPRAEELPPDGEFALLKAAARRFGSAGGGCEIVTGSDAPAGSGLGGSGAMGVALAAAFAALHGERPTAAALAERAHQIEAVEAGLMGGKQDQYAAAVGGLLFLEFGAAGVQVARLAPPDATLRDLERHLVLCFTGASRLSGRTHTEVWRRFAAGDAAVARALGGLKACALEMRERLVAGDLAGVGALLARNWEHQCALVEGMRTPAMAALERVAADTGALGWKACGAGAGGCMVFLAKAGRAFALAGALRAAGGTVLNHSFDGAGVAAWCVGEP